MKLLVTSAEKPIRKKTSCFTDGWGVKIQMLHCLYQNPLFCFCLFSRYPLHFDLLVSGTDTKKMVSKKSLRSNITIMESLNPAINYGLNG